VQATPYVDIWNILQWDKAHSVTSSQLIKSHPIFSPPSPFPLPLCSPAGAAVMAGILDGDITDMQVRDLGPDSRV
jgi:hypothetical protein